MSHSDRRKSLLPVLIKKPKIHPRTIRRSLNYLSFLVPKSILRDNNFKNLHISLEQNSSTRSSRDNINEAGRMRNNSKRFEMMFSPLLRTAIDEDLPVTDFKRNEFGYSSMPTRTARLARAARQSSRGAQMSTNDLRHAMYSPAPSNFGSLARSATTSRVVGSPKAFGEKTYMNKEDHERERARWLVKLDEIEARLAESETLNSDMHQIKAELNKKIVDLEKNQRPLIEQNRKVADRNRTLQQEMKKVEQKLCHSQDDFLTLKDAHDRLTKENASLKEKRAYPEKLEELERYRNQVLEYSKCITALRGAGLEKDRRYELLVQKFKRLRKCIKKSDFDDDGRSTVGSDCSAESSVSLDTINEDFEESLNKDIEINYQALYRENAELQRALHELKLVPSGLTEEAHLRDQLAFAHTTIAQQQILIEGNQDMISQSAQLKSIVLAQQDKIKNLEQQLDDLRNEIAASKDVNELLEFQVIEMEETSKSEELKNPGVDKSLDTEETFEDSTIVVDITKKDFTEDEVSSLMKNITELTKAANLKLAQRQTVGATVGYIGNLEEKVVATNAVVQNKTVEYEGKIKELMAQVEESYSKQKKKKELQIEVEELRKKLGEMDNIRETLNEEMKSLSKELSKLRSQLHTKDTELEKEKKIAEGLNQHLQTLVESSQHDKEQTHQRQKELDDTKKELESARITVENLLKEKQEIGDRHKQLSEEYEKFKEEQRPSIRTELERRYEETKYRLNTALEKIMKYEIVLESANRKEDDAGKLSEALQDDLVQLKGYNEHLERQFQAQTDIIDALKDKVIQQKSLADFVNKLADEHDAEVLQEELQRFGKKQNKDAAAMANNIAHMIEVARKNSIISAITPLEISTAHHKVRPYNSVDSSGEWQSNSSEGVTSPEEGDSADWGDKKTHREIKCGGSTGRSESAQSS